MIGKISENDFMDLVIDQIPKVENRMRKSVNDHNPELKNAIDHLLSSGGKRIRPTVTLLTGGMLGADQEICIILAAAIEMLHTATLVHDDLIDGALLRRGISTLNARWSPAATVLTGDYLFARAAKLAAETGSIEVMQLFADTLATIVNGEINQMFPGDGLTDLQKYEKRIYAKTASMFELATTAAATLSPVSQNTKVKMGQFGFDIGMAFQIIDDVLDLTGKQATVGKPVASDLRLGIITLPVIYYIDMHPDDKELQHILSGNHYEEHVMDSLVHSLNQSGAIERAVEEAKNYVDNSITILSKMPENPEKESLIELASYIIDRKL
ncbi:MAG: polyprenyl synthetase family protein [Anaerolineales bacterium]